MTGAGGAVIIATPVVRFGRGGSGAWEDFSDVFRAFVYHGTGCGTRYNIFYKHGRRHSLLCRCIMFFINQQTMVE